MKESIYKITYTTPDLYQAECRVTAFTERQAIEIAKNAYMSIEHIDKIEKLN